MDKHLELEPVTVDEAEPFVVLGAATELTRRASGPNDDGSTDDLNRFWTSQ